MATTYADTPAALAQLIAHFEQVGNPFDDGENHCDTLIEIERTERFPQGLTTYTMDKTDPDNVTWFIGAEQVEHGEVYASLFQI